MPARPDHSPLAAAHPGRAAGYREAFWPMVGRRALTGPLFALVTALAVLTLPVTVPLAIARDVSRGGDWITVRCLAVLLVDLLLHVVGLVALPLIWLFAGLDPGRRARWNLTFEVWWAGTALRAVFELFRMRVEVTGADALVPGPFILFPRHASLLDTLLPFTLIAERHRMHLRYVMKHALLWDPCIDVMGHREPSAFVRRGTRRHAREIAKVAALTDGLGPHDGVVIFPEGTRFTPEKREKRLAWLAENDPESHQRAVGLRYVLPPRFGGPLALLDAEPPVDVVFCAHTGLEGANHLSDLLDGTLLDGVIQVDFRRIAAVDIPRERADRIAWLYAQWRTVDAWVALHRAGRPS